MKTSNLTGPVYLLKGIQKLFQHSLTRYLMIPLLINLLLSIIFIFIGMHLIHQLAHALPHYLHWLAPILDIFFFLGSLAAFAYGFVMLTNLLGAPFNSLLSSKVEGMVTGKKPFADDTLKEVIKDTPRFLTREKDKLCYYLPRALLLFLIFFIPVINVAASIIWFLFNGWMMGIQYLDYPMDNHKMSFEQTRDYLRRHKILSLTFGLSVMVLSMIPIVNLITMPAAVIGATLLFLDNA